MLQSGKFFNSKFMVLCKFATNEEWRQFLEKHPDFSFLQSNFWSEFREKVGWKTWKIGVFEDGEIIAGTVVMKFATSSDTNFLYIPEGPLLPYQNKKAPEYWELMINMIEEKLVDKGKVNTSHLRMEPRIEQQPDFFNDFIKATSSFEPRNTLLIDLTQTEEGLLKAMHTKARYNIKLAQKHGVQVREGINEKNSKEFLELYQSTVGRKKFPFKQQFYFEKLLPLLERENAGTIFVAEYEKTPLAAALVIFSGERATYFFGGSSMLFRSIMAPYLLHWEIIRHAKKSGYIRYDFWGVSPKPVPSDHPWKTITAFKEKFGGKRVDFVPTLDKIF